MWYDINCCCGVKLHYYHMFNYLIFLSMAHAYAYVGTVSEVHPRVGLIRVRVRVRVRVWVRVSG